MPEIVAPAAPAAPAPAPSAPSTPAKTTPSAPSAKPTPSATPSASTKAPVTKDNIHAYLNSPERLAKLDAMDAEIESGNDSDPVGDEPFEGDVADDSDSLAEVSDSDIAQDPVTSGDPDFSWAQELADYKDGLHGVGLKELLEALRSGKLPEALYDKVELELLDGDNRWTDTINGARNGAMMRKKFQQKTAEFAEQQKTWSAERDDFVDNLRGWKGDPELLIDGLERLGMPLDAAARIYSERLGKLNHIWTLEQQGQVPEGTTKQLYDAQERDRELRDMRHQETVRGQREQAARDEQQSEQITQVVTRAGAQALQNVGLDPQDKAHWGMFRRNINELMQQNGAVPTREDVVNCALAVKEEIQSLFAAHERAKTVAPNGSAIPQQRVAPRNTDPAPAKIDKQQRRGAGVKPITTKEWLRKNRFGMGA